jgi:hypothetical protein
MPEVLIYDRLLLGHPAEDRAAVTNEPSVAGPGKNLPDVNAVPLAARSGPQLRGVPVRSDIRESRPSGSDSLRRGADSGALALDLIRRYRHLGSLPGLDVDG